jgi:hypothetical protein
MVENKNTVSRIPCLDTPQYCRVSTLRASHSQPMLIEQLMDHFGESLIFSE